MITFLIYSTMSSSDLVLCASFDLDLQAEHIAGYLNEIADLLSR